MLHTDSQLFVLTRIFLGAILLSGVNSTFAAEQVTVELKNGHILKGEIDAETDSMLLWIRRIEPGIVISSSYKWSAVARLQHRGRWVGVTELRPLVEQWKSKSPDNFFLRNRDLESPTRNADRSDNRLQRLPASHRIQSVQIEGYVANWDQDVSSDGIELHLFPLDAENRVIPVYGSLDIRLFGRALQHAGRKGRFPQLERWTKKINSSDFKDGQAVFRLTFRKIHPEFDFHIGNDALLHVRLSVPGQGVFEASDALLQLRPPSRFRDQLQQQKGTRFLPVERVSRK